MFVTMVIFVTKKLFNPMLEFLKNAQEVWVIVSGIVLAVSGYFVQRRQRKKKSMRMLFEEFELMKQKLITGIKKEIEYARKIQELKQLNMQEEEAARKKITRLTRIQEELRDSCPTCYAEAIEKIDRI